MTVGYILREQVEHVSEAVKKNTGSANVCKYVAQSNYPISYWFFQSIQITRPYVTFWNEQLLFLFLFYFMDKVKMFVLC